MDNELLFLIKKHTDTFIEQTRTKPQETLEFKMNKQRQTFSFNPPINLIEEDKWLLAVSLIECTNSVFNKKLMRTIRFQSLCLVITKQNLLEKLLIN